jgi:hypothetical protein
MAFLQRLLPGRSITWRSLAWILPVFAVWAMFHGPGSLWGIALLGVAAVGDRRNRAAWTAVAGSAGLVVVLPGVLRGLVNSFGVHTESGMQAAFVPEHWPLWRYADAGLGLHAWLVLAATSLCLLGGLGALATVATSGRERRHGIWPLALASLGTGLFSVLMARFAWYSLVSLVLAGYVWKPGARRVGALVALALGLFVYDASTYVMPRYRGVDRWVTDVHPGVFPEAAATVLAEAGVHGRIFNESGWGGYLLYRLHPGSTVLTDGRIAFGADVGNVVRRDRRRDREAILEEAAERFGIDLVVRATPTFAPGQVPTRWVRLYGDDVAEVWARRDAALPERVQKVERLLESLSARGTPSP